MTDNDIIKALECCSKAKTRADCEKLGCPACEEKGWGCVYYNRTDEEDEWACFAEIGKDLVDLINRQKAEIERWQEECGKQSVLWSKHFESIFESAKEVVRAEAITEFEERLKDRYADSPADSYTTIEVLFSRIDQTAKEMKEGVNNA